MACTPEQLRDPKFCSYEKSLAVGEKPTRMQCAECRGPAMALPCITMTSPFTGTLVCPHCWHPLIGRTLLTLAQYNKWTNIPRWISVKHGWEQALVPLVSLGLVEKSGRRFRITNAGLAALWLKESVGWEFENAHANGWYRTERFPIAGKMTGYFANDGKWGQFMPHHAGSHRKVWPIKGIGILRLGKEAA